VTIDEMLDDYKPFAVRDDHHGNTVVSFKAEDETYMLSISGKLLGPLTLRELEAIEANIKDVRETPVGLYRYLTEYDARGNRTE